nr:MAG TPA: hypothetical protein [Caudoviricetes sp.]
MPFCFLEMVHIFSCEYIQTIPILMYGLLISYENHLRSRSKIWK